MAIAVAIMIINYAALVHSAFGQESTLPGSESEVVRKKVREKIENLLNKPRAIVGTLSAITDSSLQIETRTGDVLLASTEPNTVYFRISKSRRTKITFKELVLKDFIIAMGFQDRQNVLRVLRIITYDTPPIVEKKVIMGTIDKKTSTKMFVRELNSDKTWEITISKKTKITASEQSKKVKLTDLRLGDKIIVVGIPSPDLATKLEATRVHRLTSSKHN